MSLFLITFLTIYCSLHLYVLFKLRNAFKLSDLSTRLLILLLLVMTFTPFLVRLAEYSGMTKTAQILAWPGFFWMGFMFIFVSILLFTDLLRYFYQRALCLFPQKFLPELLSASTTSKMSLVLAIFASLYACFEAGQIRTEHITIASTKLAASASRVRIVQVSDVHIGLLLGDKKLTKIADKIKDAEPDILISTGDLLDGKLNRDDNIQTLNSLAKLLASITAPAGKFAVIGNHEVYAGLAQAVEFSRSAGFTVLRNQSVTLDSGLTISGIDDRAAKQHTPAKPITETELLKNVPNNSFHLLLKHRPEILQESDGKFDLQLSGHVHKGQIFPFNFLVKLKHPIPCGTSTTTGGSRIYVSRGTGTWGPPMRLFAPPEITIIDIIAPSSAK